MEKLQVGQKTFITLKVSEIIKLYDKGIFGLNLFSNGKDIQRNNIWNRKQMTDFFDTLIRMTEGLIVPTMTAIEKKNLYEMADGKQRISAILALYSNQVKLAKLSLYKGRDYSNRTFTKLPEELQRIFLDAELTIETVPYQSDQQVRELFIRLNSGSKLHQIEKLRGGLTTKMPFLEKVASLPFFTKDLKFTPDALKHYGDIDLALWCLMVESGEKDHASKTKEVFVERISQDLIAITKNTEQSVLRRVDFLHEIFAPMHSSKEEKKLVQSKVMASSNRIMIYKLTRDFEELGVDAKTAYEFLKSYYVDGKNNYSKVAGTTSTAGKGSMEKRYDDLKKGLRKYISKIA